MFIFKFEVWITYFSNSLLMNIIIHSDRFVYENKSQDLSHKKHNNGAMEALPALVTFPLSFSITLHQTHGTF